MRFQVWTIVIIASKFQPLALVQTFTRDLSYFKYAVKLPLKVMWRKEGNKKKPEGGEKRKAILDELFVGILITHPFWILLPIPL